MCIVLVYELCQMRGGRRNFLEPYKGTVKENLLMPNKAVGTNSLTKTGCLLG